ncbi:MAG: ABC transporter permease [Ideonella sp.]|nr:ABC transporter permease [Ideonella sp.]
MPNASPAAEPAQSQWLRGEGGCTLRLAGDWRGASAQQLAMAPWPVPDGRLLVDGAALAAWDSTLIALLWDRLAPLRRDGLVLDIEALPEDLRAVLEQSLSPQTPAAGRDDTRQGADGLLSGLRAWGTDALTTIAFIGEVLLALGRLARGRSDLRGSDLLRQVDQTGPLSLPIVLLTCALVGLMLAYMGGAQLDSIGAQSLIADVVTVGMVREMAGLMTGVILSGRLGASFAAQLASMQANEEIDALRALGVDPVDYLVLPRLLALLIVAPPLLACAALVGVVAGLPAASAIYGVPPHEYLQACLNALTWTHLWIGLFKGVLYAALVALAGCREGLYAGRNAQAVGVATTSAVVKALVWIVTAACGTTVVFQALGF